MSSAAVLNWTGIVLAAVSVVVLAWAVAGRRSRQPRCQRCWYDMTGIAAREGGESPQSAIVCPECGREHAGERELRKVRRRWRWMGVALGVWVCAQVVWCVPRVMARGWVGWVPTWVLVVGSGSIETPNDSVGFRNGRVTSANDKLFEELVSIRSGLASDSDADALERWMVLQRALVGDRYRDRGDQLVFGGAWADYYVPIIRSAHFELSARGEYSRRLMTAIAQTWIQTPPRVVAGLSAGVYVSCGDLVYSTTHAVEVRPILAPGSEPGVVRVGDEMWPDLKLAIASIPSEARALEFEIRGYGKANPLSDEIWRVRVRKPIHVEDRLEEVLVARQTATIEPKPGDVRPILVLEDRTLWIPLGEFGRYGSGSIFRLMTTHRDLTIGVRAIILHDGRAVGESKTWFRSGPQIDRGIVGQQGSFVSSKVVVYPSESPSFESDPKGLWSVKYIGDPNAALLDIVAESWWDGEFEEPINVKRWQQSLP